MRIRSTKPEFWRSKKIASVSWDARLVLKGLESYVDDNGVGKDDLESIVADLFARDALSDPSRTLARVSEAISEVSEAGLVIRYTIDGEDLLYIANWRTAQRIDKPARGRYPRPDGTLEYTQDVDTASFQAVVASPREPSRHVAPGTGEQGNRGTGEQTSLSGVADAPQDSEPREEIERLCAQLASRIEGNGAKRPTITKGWRDAARLLMDRDGRTEQQVAWMIDWCQDDEFWRSNVLSMPKLREKFDQLVLRARPMDPPPRLRLAASGEPIITGPAKDDVR